MNERIQNIRSEAIELDELWTIVQKKQSRVTKEDRLALPDYGDTYTFVGIDPSTKLVIS